MEKRRIRGRKRCERRDYREREKEERRKGWQGRSRGNMDTARVLSADVISI